MCLQVQLYASVRCSRWLDDDNTICQTKLCNSSSIKKKQCSKCSLWDQDIKLDSMLTTLKVK